MFLHSAHNRRERIARRKVSPLAVFAGCLIVAAVYGQALVAFAELVGVSFAL